jgi:hypothetical protein
LALDSSRPRHPSGWPIADGRVVGVGICSGSGLWALGTGLVSAVCCLLFACLLPPRCSRAAATCVSRITYPRAAHQYQQQLAAPRSTEAAPLRTPVSGLSPAVRSTRSTQHRHIHRRSTDTDTGTHTHTAHADTASSEPPAGVSARVASGFRKKRPWPWPSWLLALLLHAAARAQLGSSQ